MSSVQALLLHAPARQCTCACWDPHRSVPGHQAASGPSSPVSRQLIDTRLPPLPIRCQVDPLDGTTNFVHGYPFSCVCVALAVAQEPVLGVVYNPILQVRVGMPRGRLSRRSMCSCRRATRRACWNRCACVGRAGAVNKRT